MDAIRLQTRDRSLRKVVIHIEPRYDFRFNGSRVVVTYVYGAEQRRVSIFCVEIWGLEPEELQQAGEEPFVELCKKLARHYVLNGRYELFGGDIVPSSTFVCYSNPDVPLEGRLGVLKYELLRRNGMLSISTSFLPNLTIEQRKLVRQYIMTTLYECGTLFERLLFEEGHLEKEWVEAELSALKSGGYVSQVGDTVSLSLAGALDLEKNTASYQGIVFIIAACQSNRREQLEAYQQCLSAMKRAVESQGLRPVFQEHEEPVRNIYVDIFDYISASDLIIADLSYERPNCFVEIGYAHALGKPIIGLLQSEYFSDRPRLEDRVPFDLRPIKFQEYSVNDHVGLVQMLSERIEVIKRRQNR